MGKRKKRRSKKELKPGFSRHKSALEDHVDKHGKYGGKRAAFIKRWSRDDTKQLARAVERGQHASLKPLSFDFIKQCHERILLRREPLPHVLEALDLLYSHVRGKQFEKIVRQIRGPHHDHVLVPLSKRIMTTSSKDRRNGLWAMRRLSHPAACDVAEYLFERYGRGTRIMCVQLIGECGTMRHIGSLKTLLERRMRFDKDVVYELERAIERMEAKFPEHLRQAGEGALSVSAMGDQAGALSLDGEGKSSRGSVDVHTQINQLIETHGDTSLLAMHDEEAMWFDLTLAPRKVPVFVKASMAWMPLWHWMAIVGFALIGLIMPHGGFAVTSTAVGAVLLFALFMMAVHSREAVLLGEGEVIDAAIEPRGEGHVATFRNKKGQKRTRQVELDDAPVQDAGRTNRVVLFSELSDDIILATQLRQVSVTEDGRLVPRHPWRLLGVALVCLAAFVRAAFLLMA